MLEVATGALVSVLISTVAVHGQRNELTILGDRGTITLSNDTETLMRGRAAEPMQEIAIDNPYAGPPGVSADIWNHGAVGAMRELYDVIRRASVARGGDVPRRFQESTCHRRRQIV